MAEGLGYAAVTVLLEKLRSNEVIEFTSESVRAKLKKWERILEIMKPVVSEAEEKHLEKEEVKEWWKSLLDLAYDADDILDEYIVAALKRKVEMGEDQETCWKRISAACIRSRPRVLLSEFNFNSRLDGITRRLENQPRTEGVLRYLRGRHERPATPSWLPESLIYGRDEDQDKLIEMLLMDKPQRTDFAVISIVGMPGVGKTVLAQLVYNSPEVSSIFVLRAWVFVSEYFDVTRISNDLLESFTNCVSDALDLGSIQFQLREFVRCRRFLLVLDDVWSANPSDWELLLSPLMAGAQGSRIIVTTPHESVASMVTTFSEFSHRLGLLSDDDCGSIFVRYLHFWEMPGAQFSEILPALQLSYRHLPLHLKRCFVYCAIFPNGYEFEEKEVVLLWMAENLIPQSRDSIQLEDLGGQYFHNLVSRSIFQKSSGNNSKYIMHSLFNYLALELLGGRSFSVEYHNSLPRPLTPSTRHVSSLYYPYTGKSEVFTDVTPLRTYLSLLPVNNCFKPYDVTGMFVSNLLEKGKKLRTLSLQNYNIRELPDSIEGLSLLQLLNLSGSEIRSLPRSINSLCNLQTLILRNCRNLSKLPLNLGNLIRLRHFDIFGACLIDRMPWGMHNWKFLRTLSSFIVGKGSCSSLYDLKNLEFLFGEMHVTGLENMIVLESTPDVMILSNKKDLKVLLLNWGSKFDDIRDARVEEMVLGMLQPHQNLEELTIRSYCGTQFSWLGNKTFALSSAVTILKLEDCIKCTFLPTLGLLGFLKNLSIKGLIGIQSVGLEFYGENNSTPFPSLESLSLEGLEEWEEWIHLGEEESAGSFPELRELSIVGCNKLCKRLPKHLKLLKKLVVRNCKELVVSFSTFPSLCKLEIDECKKLVCDSPIGSKSLNSFLLSNVSCAGHWLEQGFQRVEVLSIKACDELVELLGKDILLEQLPQSHGAISVRELCVEKCENVTTLLEGIIKHIAGLEILQIEGCNSLTFVGRGQLPASLKKLDIRNCINLLRFLQDYGPSSSPVHSLKKGTLLENVNSSILQLEELYIQECPSLICLPPLLQFSASLTHLCLKKCAKLTSLSSRSPLPTVLKLLEVEDCLKLTTLLPSGELPETLERLKISGCPKLKSIVERFHNNTSLREILIEGCEKLKCIPEGISTLTSLCEVDILYCPCLVSFPEGGFPKSISHLWIKACEKLQALPSQMHNLPCLQLLSMWDCPNMSFHVEGLPKNLESLAIQGYNLYQALQEEDLLQLTSLKEFSLCGLPDTLSFEVQKMEQTLPSGLTRLYIGCFPNLEDLSSLNIQDLENLEWLSIDNCPKLKSLPSLPPSLVELYVNKCPLLENKGRRGLR